jgi:hypothetical protein
MFSVSLQNEYKVVKFHFQAENDELDDVQNVVAAGQVSVKVKRPLDAVTADQRSMIERL